MTGSRILVVEDDNDLLEMLVVNFEHEGYLCHSARDGEDGLAKAKSGAYSLVVLDRVLPKLNGTDVLVRLRQERNEVPVIFLTSKGEELDKVLGLELGADDYVTKPFQFGELNARVRAILRRTEIKPAAGAAFRVLSFAQLSIDPRLRKVFIGERVLRLTALEYDLLLFLASNADVPQSREQILAAVWQTTFLGYEDSVNTAIKRLRQKIEENPAVPEFIHTLRNVGYVFSSRTK